MNRADELDLLARARAAGLLNAEAEWPESETGRPWPVVLLTAIGAWLAAVPLAAALMFALGPVLRAGAGPLVIGMALIAFAVAALRKRDLPLFVEQLSLPLLLAGGCSLGYGLYNLVGYRAAPAVLLPVTLGVAVAVSRAWLRVLLGVLAAWLAMQSWALGGIVLVALYRVGLNSIHLNLALWMLALFAQRRWLLAGPRARWASLVEDLACGWLLQCLLMLCQMAGTSFLIGGLYGGSGVGMPWGVPGLATLAFDSGLLGLLGMAFALWAWPGLRRWPVVVAGLLLSGLCLLMPSLGAVLLALPLLCCSGRWRQAGAAALAAIWVLGAFYYSLQMPLAQKALWLALAGAAFALLALAMRPSSSPAAPSSGPRLVARDFGWGALAFVMLTLCMVNAFIAQKQHLISTGRPVYISLAPVDPRSLMQGDFMRLRFALPPAVSELQSFGAARPQVVVKLDERGVGQPLRLAPPNEVLAADEMLLELTPKDGRWIIVSDAWFFREGEGARFAKARFGEFRVAANGRALLVGLADEALRPLAP